MADMFEKIAYPKGGHFRNYCYECSSWVRDYDRESDMKDVWNIDVAEPQGRCDGILTDKYRQACPLFVKRKECRGLKGRGMRTRITHTAGGLRHTPRYIPYHAGG